MSKMKIILLVLLAFLFFTNVFSNPMTWPYMPASDYFRGTVGERLYFDFSKKDKGSFYINDDLRYYHFKYYWDQDENKCEYNSYSRLINIFSLGYTPFDKIQFSVRIPYVSLKNQSLSNSGLSDIFIGFSYQLMEISNRHLISFSSGIKLPVGYYKYEKDKLPLGTGSYDIPLIINTDFQFKNFQLFFDTGYIFTGKSEGLYPPYNVGEKFENGDEIFCDVALTKAFQLITMKLETNFYYVFNSTPESPEWADSQSKLSIVPGIIIPLFIKNLQLDLSYSFDIFGKHTFSGSSPVIRVHYHN